MRKGYSRGYPKIFHGNSWLAQVSSNRSVPNYRLNDSEK